MSNSPYYVYDFAANARVERPLAKAFSRWMQKLAELFAEHWKNFSATQIQTNELLVDSREFANFQSKWKLPAYAVEISFSVEATNATSNTTSNTTSNATSTATTGMLVIDRVELLTLLMDVLGNTDEIADRELTSVEDALCEMILQQAATAMVDSWQGVEGIVVNVGPVDQQPNRSKIFSSEKKLLASGVCIQVGEASANIQVVLAKDETSKLLGVETQRDSQPKNNERLSPQKIAEIGVEVSAGLGSVDLVMDDLVSISVGDIIVLEQSVEEPVLMFVNHEPTFRAWPGRVASKQALKIVSATN